jgi:hypothetical protein
VSEEMLTLVLQCETLPSRGQSEEPSWDRNAPCEHSDHGGTGVVCEQNVCPVDLRGDPSPALEVKANQAQRQRAEHKETQGCPAIEQWPVERSR